MRALEFTSLLGRWVRAEYRPALDPQPAEPFFEGVVTKIRDVVREDNDEDVILFFENGHQLRFGPNEWSFWSFTVRR